MNAFLAANNSHINIVHTNTSTRQLICFINFSTMGLPIHGSQNMNHIRLIYNKFNYVKTRYDFLLSLLRHSPLLPTRHNNYFIRKKQKAFSKHHHHNAYHRNSHKPSLSLPLKSSYSPRSSSSLSNRQKLKKAFPILSNMPFIHLNTSLIFVNNSPFALTDRRFGILHHHSPSISYY